MPGNLIACKPNGTYTLTFWTIERDPKILHLTKHASYVATLFRDSFPGAKIFVAPEVSDTAYAHDHVLLHTPKPCRFTLKFMKHLQSSLGYKKVNNSKISVRAFHTRRGSIDDYESVKTYLTVSKYKVKELSKDTIELDDISPRLWTAYTACNGLLTGMLSGRPDEDALLFQAFSATIRAHPHLYGAPGQDFLKVHAEATGKPFIKSRDA